MINIFLTLSIMLCDIKGAVKSPGVYEIINNNINDVIEMAGGLTKGADTTNINLSKRVTDEMVIYIPDKKEKPKICPKCECPKTCENKTTITTIKTTTSPITMITTTIPTTTIMKIVNINTASKSELISLSGIGEAIADRIIEFREITSFTSIEDLMQVKGIGEALFVKIKDFITV